MRQRKLKGALGTRCAGRATSGIASAHQVGGLEAWEEAGGRELRLVKWEREGSALDFLL